jgi:hypothetical protein
VYPGSVNRHINLQEETPIASKSEALVIEADKSWERLPRAKDFFFADLEDQMRENHRRFPWTTPYGKYFAGTIDPATPSRWRAC